MTDRVHVEVGGGEVTSPHAGVRKVGNHRVDGCFWSEQSVVGGAVPEDGGGDVVKPYVTELVGEAEDVFWVAHPPRPVESQATRTVITPAHRTGREISEEEGHDHMRDHEDHELALYPRPAPPGAELRGDEDDGGDALLVWDHTDEQPPCAVGEDVYAGGGPAIEDVREDRAEVALAPINEVDVRVRMEATRDLPIPR